MKKIVVLMSTYNGKKYLQTQIESILNQDGVNIDFRLKLLIRDDKSTDGTLEMISNYPTVEVLNNNDNNLGVKRSFFELLSKAEKADLYFFSDQDDIWPKNKVKRFLQYYENKNIDEKIPVGLFSDLWISDAMGKSTEVKMSDKYDWKSKADYRFFAWNYRVTGAAFAINFAAKKICDSIPLEWQYQINMHDSFIALLISVIGDLVQIDEPLLYYRQHGNNLVGASNKSKSLKYRVKNLFKISESMLNDNMKVYQWLISNQGKYNILLIKYKYFENIYTMKNATSIITRYKIWKNMKKDITLFKIKVAIFRELMFVGRNTMVKEKQ